MNAPRPWPGCPALLPLLPRRPAADGGRYRAPDLARARKLVAASGTAGMRVTVWDTVTPPGTVNETRDAVATAAASSATGPRCGGSRKSTYFAYTPRSRNSAQVIDGGWSADYPLRRQPS